MEHVLRVVPLSFPLLRSLVVVHPLHILFQTTPLPCVYLWFVVEMRLLISDQAGLRTYLFANIDVQPIRLYETEVKTILKVRLEMFHCIAQVWS